MILRKYAKTDCVELAELFYDTVHTVNAKDYTREQLDAWATGKVNLEAWNESFQAHHTVVAEMDGKIVGFGDMDETGYLSISKTDVVMLQSLYMLEEYQHQGIGRAAIDFVKRYCTEMGADSFVLHCLPENWNARKFYEKMGGKVISEDLDNEESWMNSVIYQFEVKN